MSEDYGPRSSSAAAPKPDHDGGVTVVLHVVDAGAAPAPTGVEVGARVARRRTVTSVPPVMV